MKVEPIRDKDDVERIEKLLAAINTDHGDRLLLLFECGIYLGMRIGDMLRLRVGDLRGVEMLEYTPQKTRNRGRGGKGKRLRIYVDSHLRTAVGSLCADLPDSALLFESTQRKGRAISRQTALNYMKEIKTLAGLSYNIGCHTLRKTFGYTMYQQYHDVAFLQEWFGHSSPAITLIYIGIADDEKRKAFSKPLYNPNGIDWKEIRENRANRKSAH